MRRVEVLQAISTDSGNSFGTSLPVVGVADSRAVFQTFRAEALFLASYSEFKFGNDVFEVALFNTEFPNNVTALDRCGNLI